MGGIFMNDLEALEKARFCLYQLANGFDPFTNRPISDNDLLNDVRISRSLFFASNVLQDVLEQKYATVSSSSPDADSNIFTVSTYPCSASSIARRLNKMIDLTVIHSFNYHCLTEWFVSLGLLEESDPEGEGPFKRPTDDGIDLGIRLIKRTSPRGDYNIVTYSATAQQFLLDHFDELLAFQQAHFPLENSGRVLQ
jgi:hypothetical protein